MSCKRAGAVALFAAAAVCQRIPDGDWPAYGRDPGGAKYSPLAEIDRSNVKDLKIAWTFRTGDMYDPSVLQPGMVRRGPGRPSAFEATPLVVDNVLYVSTPFGRVIALEPETGKQRWAFDARTGKLRWTWDPMPGQRTGAANAWSIISVDPERKLVFVPTGSASPDYYGGERPGNNLYANCVVALRAETGERVWHFQTVHHDIWDYDVASQPALITVRKDGRDIAAVAVGSKTGHLFVLDRETGRPIFGVEERPAPKSNVAGEQTSPTQPWPLL